MAGASRDLLIRLLGDSSGMKKALSEADDAAAKHDLSLKNLAGTIGSAYAATQVIEFGRASVDAAAADEAAQVKLATTLKNTTAATDDMIAANETWITKTMFATGIADDELRPALARLVTSTHDVKEAQDLMGAAMDLSVGKGISLEAASNAIAKAHDGNSTALKKLGIETKDAEGKTLSFEGVMKNVNETFGGQAAAAADTTAGKLAIMKARFGELQESVGTALMPIMEQLVGALSGVAEWFGNLDEDTQAWIIRLGMLGGGGVLAARAISGIAGPAKTLIGLFKNADGSASGLATKLSNLSGSSKAVAAGFGIVGAAFAIGQLFEDTTSQAKNLDAAMNTYLATLNKLGGDATPEATMEAFGKALDSASDGLEKSSTLSLKAKEAIWGVSLATKATNDALGKLSPEEVLNVVEALEEMTHAASYGDQTALDFLNTWKISDLTIYNWRTTAEDAIGAQQRLTDGTKAGTTAAEEQAAAQDADREAMDKARIAAHGLMDRHFELHTETWRVEAAARAQASAWDALFGKFDEKVAFNTMTTNLDGLEGRLSEYKAKLDSGEWSSQQYWQATDNDIIGTKKEVDEYMQKLGNVPASKATEINAMIDDRNLADVEKELAWLTRKRDMSLSVSFDGKTVVSKFGFLTAAAGTDSSPGGLTLIGEKGPELMNVPRGAQIIPNHKLAGIGAGGGTTVNEFHFHGPVMGEADFIRRLEEGRQDMIRRGAILVP